MLSMDSDADDADVRSALLYMEYRKPQVLFKSVETVISMQQSVAIS